MEKVIFIRKKNYAELKQIFNVSNVTIWKALNYKSNSNIAKQIREFALEKLDGVVSDDCDFETTDSEFFLCKIFNNNVKLVFDKIDNILTLTRNDIKIKSIANPSLSQLLKLQHEAKKLSFNS